MRRGLTLAQVIAQGFARLQVDQQVRLLRRLLIPVGPLALLALAGGAFAKFARQARWPRMCLSPQDAARITSAQVLELAKYVEQSKPAALQQALLVVARGVIARHSVPHLSRNCAS